MVSTTAKSAQEMVCFVWSNCGNNGDMDACTICSSKILARIGVPNHNSSYTVFQCRGCDFVFTLPLPSTAELYDYYNVDYFESSVKGSGYADYYTLGEHNMRRMWPEFKAWAGIVPKCLLDVGSASGAFLDEARKDGVKVTGVELGLEAVERSRTVYGLDTRHGDLFSSELNGGYDCITMWHVLEHIIDPVQTIRRAVELLDVGGHLFIELPQWNSVGRFAKGMSWAQLVPPGHINYWTVTSMSKMLAANGLAVVKIGTVGLAHSREYCEKYPMLSPVIKLIETAVSSAGFGGYLRVVARKA